MAKAGIVYVGTSDGLVTYSDPGGTRRWRRVGQALEGERVRAILAADALTLLVIAGGARRTTDGGQSWVAAPEEEARLLALVDAKGPIIATAHGPAQWHGEHPPAPGASAMALLAGKHETLLAAIADGTTLVRSEDGGATWGAVTVEGGLKGGIQALVPASYHMDITWAGTDQGQLLRSDDRGRTWREVASERNPILSLAVVRLV